MAIRVRALREGEPKPDYARHCSRCNRPLVAPDGAAYYGDARFCSAECRAADQRAYNADRALQQTIEWRRWRRIPKAARPDFQGFLRGYLAAHPEKRAAVAGFLEEGA